MGAALPAIGSIGGALIGAEAAGSAADAQAQASQQAAAEQRRQFDITQQQLTPFREAGVGALEQQQGLLGLGGQEAQQAAFQAFGNDPGQQFLRQQQERSLLRNAGAIGGLGGGNVRSALQQQAFGRAQTGLQQRLANLAGLSGAGQRAAVQTGTFGQQAATQAGQFGQEAAQARASGILGQTQALQGGLGDISQLLGQQFTQ